MHFSHQKYLHSQIFNIDQEKELATYLLAVQKCLMG